MNDWIELTAQTISPPAAMTFAIDPAAGAIDLFLGATRAQTNDTGQALTALDYEAYPEMAIEQMRDLARRCRERWPILKLVLLHRTGRVAVGEPSVLIVVSTPHRAEAFEACRWLIDTLKVEVAIWKKDDWREDGKVRI